MKYNKSQIIFLFAAVAFSSLIFLHTPTLASDTGIVHATVSLAICGNGDKEPGEQCDLGDLNGRACVDLGFDGGTLGCSVSCEFDATSCTTSASAHASVVLPPIASAYVLTDGADSIATSFPSAFYPDDLYLFLFSHSPESLGTYTPPTNESSVGKLFNLLFVNDSGDSVHHLTSASEITLSYADMDVGELDENTLAPYRSEDEGATWSAIADYTRNTTAKTITFSVNDFSIFSIFGSPHVVTVSTSSGSTGGGGGGIFVYPKITQEERKQIIKIADFNNDGRVDIIDFSILLYHNDETGPAIAKYDLFPDGHIDITDVSIVLYYWDITK